MKKRNIKILLVAVAVFIVVCGYFVYDFYHPRIGSRSGRVIDAVTGKPVEGAVVVYVWEFGGLLTLGEGIAAFYEGTTDNEGRYFITARRAKRDSIFRGAMMMESVVIYKDGYAAYKLYCDYFRPPIGRSFGYLGQHQKYRKKDNLVTLYPWKNEGSHREHIKYIEYTRNYQVGKLLRKELEKERERADNENK